MIFASHKIIWPPLVIGPKVDGFEASYSSYLHHPSYFSILPQHVGMDWSYFSFGYFSQEKEWFSSGLEVAEKVSDVVILRNGTLRTMSSVV
jgi:hypothetical protein